jgi:hypothetical protein
MAFGVAVGLFLPAHLFGLGWSWGSRLPLGSRSCFFVQKRWSLVKVFLF